MSFSVALLIWFVGLGALSYHRLSLKMTIFGMLGGLFIGLGTGLIASSIFFCLLLITIILLLPFSFKQFRINYITEPAFKFFKKSLPNMSTTEKTALEAGTVCIDGDLFSGKLQWQKILTKEQLNFTAAEQEFLDGPVQKLLRMIDDWDITHNRKDLPPNIWNFLKSEGFFGLIIPKEYGGHQFSALLHSEVLARIAGKSITVGSTVAVPNSLGPSELLLHYGTPEQKSYYLPRLASGQEVPCFALTNPIAGSDATAIPDKGIVCHDKYKGKNVLGVRLNWEKRYITLAPIATVLGLAFKLYDPDHLLGEETEIGITCALIPTDTAGIEIGRRHLPLNAPFQNGPTKGTNVFIPIDWLIGGAIMAGQGWKMLVECLSCGRAISLPSSAAGGIKIQAAASGYARIRRQFKQPLANFEGIQEPLARIAANAYVCEAARRFTAKLIDNGESPAILGAIIKYHITELASQTIRDSMDIHGGKAIMMGPNNYLANTYQNMPIPVTVEGANILTRSLIIFGQGAIRCHPFIQLEMTAAIDVHEERGLEKFDNVFTQHIGFTISNAFRSLFMGLSNSCLLKKPVAHKVGYYYNQLTRASSAFAFLADICMLILGGNLKFKESISGRLADMLSFMYLLTVTLQQYDEQGSQEADYPIVQWIASDLLHKFWQQTDGVLCNLPNKAISLGLRAILMPIGNPIKAPTDDLNKRVANLITTNNETRNRLIKGAYLEDHPLNPIGKLEAAFQLIVQADPIEERLILAKKEGIIKGEDLTAWIAEGLAANLINNQEQETLLAAEQARNTIIQVDDFAKNELVMEQEKRNNKKTR